MVAINPILIIVNGRVADAFQLVQIPAWALFRGNFLSKTRQTWGVPWNVPLTT